MISVRSTQRFARLAAGALEQALASPADREAVAAMGKLGMPEGWAAGHLAAALTAQPAVTDLAKLFGEMSPRTTGVLGAYYSVLRPLLPHGEANAAALHSAVAATAEALKPFTLSERQTRLADLTALLRCFETVEGAVLPGAVTMALETLDALRVRAAGRAGEGVAIVALPQLLSALLAASPGVTFQVATRALTDLIALMVDRSPRTSVDVRVRFSAAALVELRQRLGNAADVVGPAPDAPLRAIAAVRQELEAEQAKAWGGLAYGVRAFAAGGQQTEASRIAFVEALRAAAAAEPAPTPATVDALERMRCAVASELPRLEAREPAAVAAFHAVTELIKQSAAIPHGARLYPLVEGVFRALCAAPEAARAIDAHVTDGDAKAAVGVLLAVDALGPDGCGGFAKTYLAPGSRRFSRLSFDDVVRLAPLAREAHRAAQAPAVGVFECLARAVQTSGAHLDDEELTRIASTYTTLCTQAGGAERVRMVPTAALAAALVARDALGNPDVTTRTHRLMRAVAADLDDTAAAKLVDGRGIEPTLLDLMGPSVDEAEPRLLSLFDAIGDQEHARGTADNLRAAAMRIVGAAHRIQPPEVQEKAWLRIESDFVAAIERGPDAVVDLRAGRARKKPDLERELAELVGLPLEAYPTLIAHLDAPARDALLARAAGLKKQLNRGYALRDAIFCCVGQGQLDLLRAIATSDAPGAIVEDVIQRLAAGFRIGEAGRVFPDAFLVALQQSERVNDVLKRMYPQFADEDAPAAVPAQPEPREGAEPLGPKEPQEVVDAYPGLLKGLKDQVKPGKVWAGAGHIDLGAHSVALNTALAADARGTWRAERMAGPLADRIFAGWTPEERHAYGRPLAVGDTIDVEAPPSEAVKQAAHALRGVVAHLEHMVGGAAALGLLVADLPVMHARLAAIAEARHAVVKGSAEHIAMRKEVAELNANHAIATFVMKMREPAGQNVAGDPRGVLQHAEAALMPLAAAMHARGLVQLAAALEGFRALVPRAKVTAIGENYALASPDILAFVTPFGGNSCLNPATVHNAPALVEFICNPGYLMIRAILGGQPKTRQLLRAVQLATAGVPAGPAISLDIATGVTNQGYHGVDAEHRLAARCGLAMALACNKPLISAIPTMPELARELGFQVIEPRGGATFDLDAGVTGKHHGEWLGAAYFVPMENGKGRVTTAGAVIAIPPRR